MNRWILRGLATAGCAAGGWLLTAAPAAADAPTTTTAHHAEAGPLLDLRLDRAAGDKPVLRVRVSTTRATSTTRTSNPARRAASSRTRHDSAVTARVSAAVTRVATAHSKPKRQERPAATGTARRPLADTRTAVRLDRHSLTVCLNAAVLGNAKTCRTTPPTRTATSTEPVATGTADAEAAPDPIALDACVTVGVQGNATPCGSAPDGSVDGCLTIGSAHCAGSAATDGIDPGTDPGTDPTGYNDSSGTGNVHQDGGRDVLAASANALTSPITELPRTAALALTGSALAGLALGLIAAGFLLVVGSRRRRRTA